MATFDGNDGTRLVYHQVGEGRPLICLPGGPMQASAYLGDLGGLSAHRRLVRLDLRGTGESAAPADPATCAAGYAGLFPQAEITVQPASGHYPWRDDPEGFVQTLMEFLH